MQMAKAVLLPACNKHRLQRWSLQPHRAIRAVPGTTGTHGLHDKPATYNPNICTAPSQTGFQFALRNTIHCLEWRRQTFLNEQQITSLDSEPAAEPAAEQAYQHQYQCI